MSRPLPLFAVHAQPPVAWRRRSAWFAPVLLCAAAGGAQAQEAGGLRIVPGIDLTVTRTDNSNVAGRGQAEDTITVLRPGLSISKVGGPLRGNLDYSAALTRRELDAPGVAREQVFHNLNARATYDLLPQGLQINAYALASRQTISAYGLQTVDSTVFNANQAQTLRAGLAPSLRGVFGDVARYDLTLNADGYHARNAPSPNALQAGATLQVTSLGERRRVGWNVFATQQRSRYSGSVPTDNGRAYASVVLRPDIDLSMSLRAGAEAVKVGEGFDRRYENWGADLTWSPTPRTRAALSLDERYFGRSHVVQLDHRFANTTVRFSSTQNLANNAGGVGGVGRVGVSSTQTLLQAYMNLQQFVTAQPDPGQREVLVRAFLKSLGLDPNAVVGGGFLNAGTTLQRRDDVGWTYSGPRFNLTAQAFRTDSRRLDGGGNAIDNTRVLQKGALLTGAYKVTPTATLSASHTRVKTGPTVTLAGNDLQSSTVGVSERIGRYTTVGLNARHTVFETTVNPYRESALSVTLGIRF